MNRIGSNSNSFFLILYAKVILHVWKFDFKKIYPNYQTLYTDIDPTVDFVFPCQQNRLHKQWDK